MSPMWVYCPECGDAFDRWWGVWHASDREKVFCSRKCLFTYREEEVPA